MRLSMQDKNEMLKAAARARVSGDLDGLVTWLLNAVDATDSLTDGKYDVPVPPYQEKPRTQPSITTSPILPIPGDTSISFYPEHPDSSPGGVR
jgi:hypothetical protein